MKTGIRNMNSILMLVNDLPLVMVPATFIAATLMIALVSGIVNNTGWPFKSMVLATMLAVTTGLTIFSGPY